MKKNNKAFTVAPWLKQLMISIVGTSIGVGLSFTVNRMVETHKQQKDQRETALMAVYDIGEILRQIKAEEEQEDRMFRATRYVMTHQEELDSISPDTLYMVIDYLFDNPAAVKGWAVDTRENTFNSSMEARRNLGDIQFYDNVQSCYQVRRELKQAIEKTQIFKRPFTSEDFENFLQQLPLHERNASASKPGAEATAKFMRMFFPSESIRVYLLRHLKRKEHFNSAIIELERLNRENKYLMNITDKDMEDYVRQGKIRSLGLSNWYIEELTDFLPQVHITPALVQNEIHPYYQEKQVVPFIQEKGIVVQCWYPLGGRGYTGELLGDPVITEIANRHGVTSAQVILRWDL